MPELAEVEYYRRQWDCALGEQLAQVHLHERKRIFRSVDTAKLRELLVGSVFVQSRAHGKQMLFRFSRDVWLCLHLGMTGKLRVEPPSFKPGKHDHLALYFAKRALVFSDPRLFGRVLFHHGSSEPQWWRELPPAPQSKEFTRAVMENFLQRHRRLSVKAALLLQCGFPGVGNWMADEILWRAHLAPQRKVGDLASAELKQLWQAVRFVCRAALEHISPHFDDPPAGWLFHERWSRQGKCPIHKTPLRRETVGGRTTVWCSKCQT